MTLSTSVAAHEKIRIQMIATKYPNISDLKTTVEFLIEGLKQNPIINRIGLQLLCLNPVDIKDFFHKFNRI